MRLVRVAAVVTLALLALLSGQTIGSASASDGPLIPVVRCPTGFGSPNEQRTPPRTIEVLHDPSSTRGLVAYTNTDIYVIGPAGMQCSGSVGEDSCTDLVVWPRGLPKPAQHSRSDGITLTVYPLCASGRAEIACPFFPKLAASVTFPCSTASLPRGESKYVIDANATTFEDPPGVAGDGWPSGGPDPANGIVGINSNQESLVYRSTCTLPKTETWICTVSLNDVFDRYGVNPSPQPSPPKPKAAPSPSKPSTLYVHDFSGNKLAVSAAVFADPATAASQFDEPPSGSRLVAIQFNLSGDGPGTINSDADDDSTLIGSNGQAYTPSFDDAQGCTNFSYGEFTLAPGQYENGCVVFEVPDAVNIERVTFTLTDGSVDTVYWTA